MSMWLPTPLGWIVALRSANERGGRKGAFVTRDKNQLVASLMRT
jgi:hypothetical protein